MLQKPANQAKGKRPAGGMKRRAGRIGLAIAVGVAYFLAAQLGLALLTAAERVAVFWPASGIAAGVLVALGRWACAPVAVAVLAASAAAALLSDRNVWSGFAFALCNAGEALIVMWLIERWFGPAFNIDSLRRVLGFFAAAVVATATAAAGAAGAMQLFGPSRAAFLDVWGVWFASDALGVITVAPLLIGVAAAVRDAPSWRELLEGTVAVLAVTATIGFLLTILSGPRSLIGPPALLFPLLLWLGYRCRPVFAAAAVFTIAGAIVWTTTHEFGRYGDPTQPIAIRVLAAQIAMLGATLAGLALAALFAERRRHEAAIVASQARLRSVLDAANVIAWDVDLTRDTVHSAGPVARLLNRPEGSVPRDFAAMVGTIHPDDRDSVMAQFWTAVSTAATYRLEFRLNSDGLCWVTAVGSIERDADGRPVRVRGITQDITERKKTELALAEREAQLGLAGKAARAGSFAVDYDTERIQTSPGYAAIHGLAEGTEEYPRAEWRARVHPDDLPRLAALRSQAFAERRREHHMEYRIVGADGKARWIESRGLVSYDGDGRPMRLVGVHIDITERKRAEDRLQKSERKLRELLGALPAAIYVTDAAGRITYCNQSAVDLWGVEPRLGKDKWSDLDKLHHVDGSPMALADCPTGIALNEGGIVRGHEAIVERKDGTRIPVIPYPTPLRDETAAIVGVVNMTVDISERKRAELALAERNLQLALAGKAALVGSYAYDIGADVLQVEEGYAALHGLPDGTRSTTRSEWKARVHRKDLARLETVRSQAISNGRSEYGFEYRIVRSTGEVRWIESRSFISYSVDGRPQRVVGVSIDITERKRAEDKLQESERKLRELLGALPAAIYVTDAAGYVTYCNQSAVDLWGEQPALGKDRWFDLSQFFYPDGSPMPPADCPTAIALQQGRMVRGREAILQRKDGTRIPIAPYPIPLRDETGAIAGVVNMTVDISERKGAELALAERNLQLAIAGKAALVGSFAYDVDTEALQVDQGYIALLGLPEGTTCTARSEWKARVHPEDLVRLETGRSQAFRDRRCDYSKEFRVIRPGGEVRWIESRSFISYNEEGRPQRVIGVNIDMTERRQAEEHLRMLVAELDHRVKNVLATISALTSRTHDANGSVADFVAALDGRIQSMAATHQLLSSQQWKGILLSDLVRRELAPYATCGDTEIDGPDVALKAEAGQAVSMVLHELTTNAAKHGALSTRNGRVSVRWYRLLNGDADARLCIEWQETGGPAVQAPDRCGYGMEVIRGLLPYELDGKVDLAFPSEGVRCRFDIPLPQLTGGS